MTKDTVLALLRHVATFGGGFLASSGYAASEDITAGVGALITLVGLAWSILDKRARNKPRPTGE